MSDDFRPVPLWSWNDRMDADQCGEMIEEIGKAGYGGAYLHTRLGMLVPFMSDDYLAAIAASSRRAAECGIAAHLYDEDRWPSGWAGGAVPLAAPRFRLKALVRCEAGGELPTGSRPLATTRSGCRYGVCTMSLGHAKFGGSCYTDLTNAEAVRCFIDHAYEPLSRLLRNDFGTAAPSIFTDEPALTYLYSWPDGGLPWSDAIPGRLAERTGLHLVDHLDALFVDEATSPPVRIHYYRICAELFEASFMRQISEWCRHHGIRWTGHFMYEHSLPLHFSWAANCHPSYRWFDWPGVDHLGRQVGEVVTAIGCRSAVHQFAKPRMMTELYGASGQHLSFADRKWIGEQQLVLGANHLVPHLVGTTLLGARKRDYPPTLSPHQPWWPANHVVEEHFARLCAIMGEGVGEPDLLLIHPQESTYVWNEGPVPLGRAPTWLGRFFHPSPVAELESLDESWKLLCRRLLGLGYVFDFGDESVLTELGSVESDTAAVRLRVGAATYNAVLIPPAATIRPTTLELLQRFVEAGGIVISLGELPEMVDGRSDRDAVDQIAALREAGVQNLASLDNLARHLPAICPPAIAIACDGDRALVWRYTKQTADGRRTLLVNLDRLCGHQVTLQWHRPTVQVVNVWLTHTFRSEQRVIERGSLAISLPVAGSCIVFEGALPNQVPTPSPPVAEQVVAASTLEWHVKRLDDNALVIDRAEYQRGNEPWAGPFPVLAIKERFDRDRYEGPLRLRYSFKADIGKGWSPALQLIVEGAERPGVRIEFNGQRLDCDNLQHVRWRDPHWHPLAAPGELLRPQNQIVVEWERFQFGDLADREVSRRFGTELESLILLGNFSVDGNSFHGPQGWDGQVEHHTKTPLADWLPIQRIRYLAAPLTVGPARPLGIDDVTNQGLPFYAGRLQYDANWELAEPPTRPVILQLPPFSAPAAEIEINGSPAGVVAWSPYNLDISRHLVLGRNHIRIVLDHSLRNLLGPHHHPDGEPAYVTPGSFRPEATEIWLEALEQGLPVGGWRDEFAVVQFGLFEH